MHRCRPTRPLVKNVYVICAFAAIGGSLFGFDISSMSAVLGTTAYQSYFGNPVSYSQGGITSSMPAGSFVGSLVSSFLADKMSRKVAIQVGSGIWIIGSILQACANGIPLLCIGRVISGIAIGICSAIVPVYQAEIAPKEIRGRVVSLQQWAITWGILIQYFIQYGSSFVDGGSQNPDQSTAAFRIPWAIQIVPALILMIGLFWLPFSPRWLASKDKWPEAITVLADLHGGGNLEHPRVKDEYKEIETALWCEREEKSSSFAALVKPRMLKRVILGMSIQMWSQLCGMNIMMYYIVYIMEAANIGNPLLTASVQYIINVVFTIPAILFIDKWGRRYMMLGGSFGMMLCLFTTGTLQGAYGRPVVESDDAENISWILSYVKASKAVVSLSYIFVAIFAMTWGPVSWTYPSEIFPSKVRAKAVSLATATNWGWNCVLAFAVPPLLWHINWRMYIIFACFNFIALGHMYFAAPETKGKTLEETDKIFENGLPAWRSAHDKQARDNKLDTEI